MKEIKANSGQSIYDVCLSAYGTMDNVFKLVVDNELENIEDNIEGLLLSYDENLFQDVTKSDNKDQQLPIASTTDPYYHILSGQSIYDVSLQVNGTLDGVFKLILENPSLRNIDRTKIHGISIIKPTPVEPYVVNLTNNQNIIYSTLDRSDVYTDSFDSSFDRSFD